LVFRSDLAEGGEPSFESLVAQITRDAHQTLSMSLENLFTLKASERRRHAA
jgi:hypothetical protein